MNSITLKGKAADSFVRAAMADGEPPVRVQPVVRLPKWAQRHIAELEDRVRRAEATIPWTKTGMEWFTIFHPDHRPKGETEHRKLFTLSESGAHCICSVGPLDCVFVGRGKPNAELRQGGEHE